MIEYENLKKVNYFIYKKYSQKIQKFLTSNDFILGKNVSNFEKNFAKFCKTKYCVGVNSGLDALILSLETLSLKKGSEIIVASNTYIATITAIIRLGLKPILVEPDLNSYNLDPNKIVKNLSKKTKGIIVTHLYGRPCEMDKIMKIVKKHKLYLIEDCSQAHGAQFKNKLVGSFGDFGCFSFYPTKNLGALGDAGAITLNNKKYYEKLLSYRNYGSMIGNKRKYKFIGYNSRLDEIHAAFLNLKLKHLNKINNKKIQLAKIYDLNLTDQIIKPEKNKNYINVFHIYNIRLKNQIVRDKLQKFLFKNKIHTQIHYPFAPHEHKIYKKYFKKKKYFLSEKIHKTTLSLPISVFHTKKQINEVCKKINFFFNNY